MNAPHQAPDPRSASARLRPERVWRALDQASFAIVSYVTPSGKPRSSGIVFGTAGRRLVIVTAADSYKARHIKDGDEVAVTVPVRRGGLLSLVAPIPPATVSFSATARVHPPGSVDVATLSKRLASLLPAGRDDGCVMELTPVGRFLTFGIGVSLRDMTKPGRALARVPVT